MQCDGEGNESEYELRLAKQVRKEDVEKGLRGLE